MNAPSPLGTELAVASRRWGWPSLLAAGVIGLVAGLLGGKALFAPAVSGSVVAVAGQVKQVSGGTKGGTGRKGAPKELKRAMADLMRDRSFGSRAGSGFLDFVSQTGEMSAEELVGALDQFMVEQGLDDALPEGSNFDSIKTILNTLLTRLVGLDSNGTGKWLVLHQHVASVQVFTDVWAAMAVKDLPLMAQLIPQMPEYAWGKLQAIRLRAMAQQNPAQAGAALEEVLAGEPDKQTNYLSAAQGVLEEYIKVNPEAAADLSLKLWPSMGSESPYSEDPFSATLSSWSQRDQAAATAWALQQKGAQALLAAYLFLIRENGEGLYEKSAEVMTNLAGADVQDEKLQTVMWEFANHFMEEGGEAAARQWVAGIADADLQRVAQEEMNAAWVRTDPTSASAWLADAPPGQEKDDLIKTLVSKIEDEDGERAFLWAQKIGDEKVRQPSMVQAMQSWLKADPLAAARALEQASPEVREAVKRQESDPFASP